MAEISFFQRYSQKENVVTNNTLLLLRFFYQNSPQKLETALNQIGEEDLNIGLNFRQQVWAELSVPDAVIEQNPITIFIETKLGNEIGFDQILNHLEAAKKAKEKGGKVWLLCLTKGNLSEENDLKLRSLESNGIQIETVTFSALSDLLRNQCSSYDVSLLEILDDYLEFLRETNLLSEYDRMSVVPCGKTLRLNEKCGVYFEPANRPSKASSTYLGLYTKKSVRLVGKITNTFEAVMESGELIFSNQKPSDLIKGKIVTAIAGGEEVFGYFMDLAHRFYLVEEFTKTDFRKTTKYGIWGARVFKLSEEFESLSVSHDWNFEPLNISTVAEELKKCSFK